MARSGVTSDTRQAFRPPTRGALLGIVMAMPNWSLTLSVTTALIGARTEGLSVGRLTWCSAPRRAGCRLEPLHLTYVIMLNRPPESESYRKSEI